MMRILSEASVTRTNTPGLFFVDNGCTDEDADVTQYHGINNQMHQCSNVHVYAQRLSKARYLKGYRNTLILFHLNKN